MKNKPRIVWTDPMKDFVRCNSVNNTPAELAQLLTIATGVSITAKQVRAQVFEMGVVPPHRKWKPGRRRPDKK